MKILLMTVLLGLPGVSFAQQAQMGGDNGQQSQFDSRSTSNRHLQYDSNISSPRQMQAATQDLSKVQEGDFLVQVIGNHRNGQRLVFRKVYDTIGLDGSKNLTGVWLRGENGDRPMYFKDLQPGDLFANASELPALVSKYPDAQVEGALIVTDQLLTEASVLGNPKARTTLLALIDSLSSSRAFKFRNYAADFNTFFHSSIDRDPALAQRFNQPTKAMQFMERTSTPERMEPAAVAREVIAKVKESGGGAAR